MKPGLNKNTLVAALGGAALISVGANIIWPLMGGGTIDAPEVPVYAAAEAGVAAVTSKRPKHDIIPVDERFGDLARPWVAARDPFQLAVTQQLPETPERVAETPVSPVIPRAELSQPQVEAVVISSSLRLAVVDGRVVHEGQEHGGHTIRDLDQEVAKLRARTSAKPAHIAMDDGQ